MHSINNMGWEAHCKMRNPMQDLAFFMHKCAKDPVTRVMGNTAIVLSLLQTAGPKLISQPPGFLLINAGSEPKDQIDALASNLAGMGSPNPRPKEEHYEFNLKSMKFLLFQKEQQVKNPVNEFFDIPGPGTCQLADKFRSLLERNHGGSVRAGWYAVRHNQDHGWVTDETRHSILRLDHEEDFRQLREDLKERPSCLMYPSGLGDNWKQENKKLSIAGSLPAAEWESHYADPIIKTSLPVLFLPHTASQPLETPEPLAIEWIGIALGGEANKPQSPPVEAYMHFDNFKLPWLNERLAGLRERLRHLPMDYEFFVMRTIRELLPSCLCLVEMVAPKKTPIREHVNLGYDLFLMVVHGICMGVESLGWHGYGFETPGSFEEMRRVLRAVREHGSLSKRELLRNQQWLTADSREAILDVLLREGLIMTTDNEITALPFADYWQRVIHRSFGEMPKPLWQGAAQLQKSTT